MKKIFFIVAALCYGFHAQAEFQINTDTLKVDSTKVNKQITKLQIKLIDLKKQLIDTQTQLPIDSAILATMLAQSLEAQVKSKKKSDKALGGDLNDAKQAEKQAKVAAKQTQKADDGVKKIERNHEKINHLTREIRKKQQQLSMLQGQ